jgi:signal transduction histidine kinase
VALTAAALGLAFLLQGLGGFPDGLIFAATIALSARFLGLGPSLFATALSVVAIDYTMLPPLGRVDFTHPEELAYFVVFLVLSLVISGMTHSLRIARTAAESHVVELEEVNRQIALQIEETQVISEHLAHANEDLTAARDAAEQLASRANRLLDVTTALSEAQLPRDVARVVVGQGFDVLEASLGMICTLDGDKIHVLDRRRHARDDSEPGATLSLDDKTPLTTALKRRETVWLPSPEQFHTLYPQAAARLRLDDDAKAYLALPLLHGDELIGGLVLGFKNPSAVGAADHAFAGLLAQSVGNALARARTFERERQDRRYAEMLSQAREEVLGIVAHDLRNPLGVAGAVLQVLAEPSLEKSERDKLITSGTRAVQQMNRLIGDLLDVMRIESGRLALEMEDLRVAAVVTQAEEEVRHLAAEQRIELTVEPADPSLVVSGDRGRLAQVFGNLLGNAMKFTPEGGCVSLRASREGNEVIFEVADTGPGISRENRAHLFDRFWQATRGDRRGVGLGLPISKGIVEAHGGRIWVASEPGKGSRFFVALPIAS